MSDAPQVAYTIKEMLDRMDRRADERHAEVVRRIESQGVEVDKLAVRVSVIERGRDRDAGGYAMRGKVIAAAIAIITVLLEFPAAAFYFGGGHG